MTSLLARRRRAEEFARLLEEGRASHDSELAHLVELSEQLRPADVGPSQDFRGALRSRLLAEASPSTVGEQTVGDRGVGERPLSHRATGRTTVPDRRRAKRRNRLIAVASSIAIAGGMVGTAAASHEALPGEPLYGLKRGLERTSLALANNTETKGKRHIEQAHNRLAEVANLVGDEPVAGSAVTSIRVITDTLGEFDTEAETGGRALLDAYRQGGQERTIAQLRGFTTDALADLDQLERLLPARMDPVVDDTRQVLAGLDGQAAQLCPNCGPVSTEGRVTGDLSLSGTIQDARSSTPSRTHDRSLRSAGRPGGDATGSATTSGEPGDSAPPTGEDAPPSPDGSPVPETTPGGPPVPGTPTPDPGNPPSPELPRLPTPSIPSPPPAPDDGPIEIRIGDLVVPLPFHLRAEDGDQPTDPESTELPSPPTPSLPGAESSGPELPGQ